MPPDASFILLGNAHGDKVYFKPSSRNAQLDISQLDEYVQSLPNISEEWNIRLNVACYHYWITPAIASDGTIYIGNRELHITDYNSHESTFRALIQRIQELLVWVMPSGYRINPQR
jgi:hypothetical protein